MREMMSEAETILSQMTLEEKAMLLSQGLIEQEDMGRFGLRSFWVADGPSGIRRRREAGNESIPLICYPSASTYACSWDRELMRELGRHLGVEAQAEDINILFGPGCNIKRSPLCGRNFEYYSEDPVLTGELAAEYITGLQAEGTGACVKHYAANNQETRRMSVNEKIDSRALHEIYLKAFEKPVRCARPWMVMTAYNKINGEYGAENEVTLKQVLRGEWDYKGSVITDCDAALHLEKSIKNGLNLLLDGQSAKSLASEVKELMAEGRITEEELDKAVLNTIQLCLKCGEASREVRFDPEEHHLFAEKVARESMVLLKNEDHIFPLDSGDSLAVIGGMAEDLRFQGGGSAHVEEYRLDQVFGAVKEICPGAVYARGYREDSSTVQWMEEAVRTAASCSKVLLCLGLPESFESEGYDRTHMRLPECQTQLLDRIVRANPNTAVLLFHGAPVEMPWKGAVKGILDAYLPGEAGGKAAAAVMFGKVNPSGKLAETVPVKLSDTPCFLNFPGSMTEVTYAEGIYVGYRYYDKKEMEVAFPFGHGLSYTSFTYGGLEIKQDGVRDRVSLWVENTGGREGKETVQLYIRKPGRIYDCPVRELRDFQKISLQPGERKHIEFVLEPEAYQIYDPAEGSWVTEGGIYGIEIGSSSRDIRLTGGILRKAEGEPALIADETSLKDMISFYGKEQLLEKLFADHPDTRVLLELCRSENPTTQAFGALNTMQTIKRTDSTVTDQVIEEWLRELNNQNSNYR